MRRGKTGKKLVFDMDGCPAWPSPGDDDEAVRWFDVARHHGGVPKDALSACARCTPERLRSAAPQTLDRTSSGPGCPRCPAGVARLILGRARKEWLPSLPVSINSITTWTTWTSRTNLAAMPFFRALGLGQKLDNSDGRTIICELRCRAAGRVPAANYQRREPGRCEGGAICRSCLRPSGARIPRTSA